MTKRIRMLLFAIGVAAVVLVALLLICSSARRPDVGLFDRIVTEDLIRSACGEQVGFDFSTNRADERNVYEVRFHVGTEDPEFFDIVTITITKAGELLDPKRYRQSRAKIEAEDALLSPDRRLAALIFPAIGRRAAVGLVLGPGGGGGGVVFTTSDGAYDVAVSEENRLREDLPSPGLNCLDLAARICRSYDGE